MNSSSIRGYLKNLSFDGIRDLEMLSCKDCSKILFWEIAYEKTIVNGSVVSFDNDIVTIDVGLKSEGRIPLSEFTRPGQKSEINIGDTFEVYVENIGEAHVASGLYSILNDKWLVVPKKKELQIDLDDIRSKAEGYLGSIPVLQQKMKGEIGRASCRERV